MLRAITFFTGIAFHPSGKYLAAASNDATIPPLLPLDAAVLTDWREIDDPGEGRLIGTRIGQERLDLRGRGGQADQVERRAADQGPPAGPGVGLWWTPAPWT